MAEKLSLTSLQEKRQAPARWLLGSKTSSGLAEGPRPAPLSPASTPSATPRPAFREGPHLRPVPAQLSAHGVRALEGCA